MTKSIGGSTSLVQDDCGLNESQRRTVTSLRAKGWSVSGIARQVGALPSDVAKFLHEPYAQRVGDDS